MRIVSSRLQHVGRPRPYLVLTLQDEDGHLGTGDAAPLPPFSPDSAAACARVLDRAHERIAPVDDSLPDFLAVGAALKPCRRQLHGVPAARFALEIALLDLLAQRRGVSVAACLRSALQYDEVPLNALLFPEPLDTLAARAAALADAGFTAVKIKLRAPDDAGFARELTALRAVRERLPLPFEIRLDPNAAWSLDTARRRLEALAPIAPRYVEQPVPAADLPRLGEQAVPWAADESLLLDGVVDRLLASSGCAAFVLKPALLGGVLATYDLALRAQTHGIAVVVTHLFDGPFALAACCEIALSFRRPPLACGLAPTEDLAAFVANFDGLSLPQLAGPHTIRSSGGPGLGVTGELMGRAWMN
jgi:L-alanine-DL-glutamate epimerase-like enolase superfamily enzyme